MDLLIPDFWGQGPASTYNTVKVMEDVLNTDLKAGEGIQKKEGEPKRMLAPGYLLSRATVGNYWFLILVYLPSTTCELSHYKPLDPVS